MMCFENKMRWSCPVLDDRAESLYRETYGEAGSRFCGILSQSPYEIAVLSRLLTHLDHKRGGSSNEPA